jgi:hypothetical protein
MSFRFIILALIIPILGPEISAPFIGAQTTTPGPSTTQPAPVRNVLASAGLPTVIDVPLHYKLLRVSIPGGQSTSSRGAAALKRLRFSTWNQHTHAITYHHGTRNTDSSPIRAERRPSQGKKLLKPCGKSKSE